MEKLLNEQIVSQVQDVFDQQLKHPVEVLFFGKKDGCPACADTHQLAEEVTAISEKLRLSVYDLDEHAGIARQYHVDEAPSLVIAGRDGDTFTDYGVRLVGIPSGHEFTSFIQDLILVSGRDSRLSQPTRDFLKSLAKPVHLQVFVTPT